MQMRLPIAFSKKIPLSISYRYDKRVKDKRVSMFSLKDANLPKKGISCKANFEKVWEKARQFFLYSYNRTADFYAFLGYVIRYRIQMVLKNTQDSETEIQIIVLPR